MNNIEEWAAGNGAGLGVSAVTPGEGLAWEGQAAQAPTARIRRRQAMVVQAGK